HLFVFTSTTGRGQFVIEQSGPGDAFMNFGLSGSTGYAMGIDNSDGDKFKIGYHPTQMTGLDISTRFTIDATGNVGIGTSTPAEQLHVFDAGSSGTPLRVERDAGTAATQGTLDVIISDFGGGTGDAILQSGTSRDIALRSNAGSGGTLILTSAGNVGIGTTGPGGQLSVVGTSGAAGSIEAHILNNTANGYSSIRIGTDAVAVAGGALHHFNSSWATSGADEASATVLYGFGSAGMNITAYHSSGGIDFYTGGNAAGNLRATITNTGNVGIGTTSPGAKLQIDYTRNTYAPGQGTQTSLALKNPGTTLGGFTGLAFRNSGGFTMGEIGVVSTGNPTLNTGGDLVFITKNSAGTIVDERVRITNAGNVGIGTTSPNTVATWVATNGKLLNVYEGTNDARVAIQGQLGAKVDMVDLGGGVNDKWMQLYTDGGITKFRSVLDNGSALLMDNILAMDIGSGNVGIGTTGPGGQLSVVGTSGAAGSIEAHILNNTANGYSSIRIGTDAVAVAGGALHHFNSSWATSGADEASATVLYGFGSAGMNITAYHSSGGIDFYTGGNAAGNLRATITNTGNVGIGTTSPGAKLQIDYTRNTYAPGQGTQTSLALKNPGTTLGGFTGLAFRNSGGFTMGEIGVVSTGNPTLNTGGDLVFITKNSAGTIVDERVRITNAGNVGIGTTSPNTVATWVATNGKLLNVYEGTNDARVAIQGQLGAKVDMVDLGGGVNDKWMQLYTDGGITKFRSVLDNGSALLMDNILAMDIGSGNVGIGTTSPALLFDVESSSSRIARFESTASANSTVEIDAASGFNSNLALQEAGADKWYVGNIASDDRFRLYDNTGGSEVFTVLATSG
ncbi:hypothetical protein JYU20_04800, partial [Bacteroidales bacterium AH-315-I05]|nr:hypothetical protein [Bacteroidales bacterium AH-315-I05]